MLTEEKKILLKLASESIKAGLEKKKFLVNGSEIPVSLKNKQACFVTLTINSKLRGCIGHLEPIRELYKDVIENSYAAAFLDSRFSPLTVEEFQKIAIEISVLGENKILDYPSLNFLVDYLEKEKPGVILELNGKTATFLPQVWQEIKTAPQFLSV